jgi:hypothetical protein
MSPDERAEVLALLDVRVQLQPDGKLENTGTVCNLDLPAELGTTGTKILHSHSHSHSPRKPGPPGVPARRNPSRGEA